MDVVGKTLLKRGLVQFLNEQDALHRGDDFTLAFVITNMTRMRDGRLLLLHASELGWCRVTAAFSTSSRLEYCYACTQNERPSFRGRDCHPLLVAVHPPIEDNIAAKWASLAIFHIIQRAEELFERVQMKYQLELVCKQSGVEFSSLDFASWFIGEDFLGYSYPRFRRYAPYLSEGRETIAADMLYHCLGVIFDLCNILESPPMIILFRVGEVSFSDLLDPHRQLFDFVDININDHRDVRHFILQELCKR